MNKTYKVRKKLLVNREYQLYFVKLVLMQTLITSFLLVGVFYLLGRSQMEFLATLPLDSAQGELARQWTWSMFMRIFLVIGVACVFQCVLALTLSHRVAGPIHRLKNYLHEISGGGDFQPIQFRHGDPWHDVQDAYNEMVLVLEKERQNDLRIVEQMEDGIARLKKLVKDDQMYQIADYLDRLNNDLKNFKTQ